jgi:hypothetical protein
MVRSDSFVLEQPRRHPGDGHSEGYSEDSFGLKMPEDSYAVRIQPGAARQGPQFLPDSRSRHKSPLDLPRAAKMQPVPEDDEQTKLSARYFQELSARNHERLNSAGKNHFESSSLASTASSEGCEGLDVMVGIGDIMIVQGAGNVGSIGEIHGLFGHVLLISGAPTCIRQGSEEADDMESEGLWPSGGVKQVWQIPTVECCRREKGTLHSELLIYAEPASDEFIFHGEQNEDAVVHLASEREKIQFLCCPGDLRARCQPELMEQTLAAMDGQLVEGSWSWSTAIRAYVFSSSVLDRPQSVDTVDQAIALEAFRTAWEANPICTSPIIIFWQQYLFALAAQEEGNSCPLEHINEYMPLKADRALPRKLVSTLKDCGWVCISRLPS